MRFFLEKERIFFYFKQRFFFQEPGELFREPRPFCYQTGIYIQHATAAIRTEPAPATDVQDQLLVAYRKVIQDCFLGEPLRRVVLRLFSAVVTLIKVQMKRRPLDCLYGRKCVNLHCNKPHGI